MASTPDRESVPANRVEGGLEAPTRLPIDWQHEEYYDFDKLNEELERVFDICHGCRRCVSLCESFPTLFDLIDESEAFEVSSVDKADYPKVSEQCYLCDLCYQTKCPYVPPHPWQVDFPHLMLRAKAHKFRKQGASFRDRVIASTDTIGAIASKPLLRQTVNGLNSTTGWRSLLDKFVGIHHAARLPEYKSGSHIQKLRKQQQLKEDSISESSQPKHRIAVFASCFGKYNRPEIVEDLVAVFEHNGVAVKLLPAERCCGMPKMELGDLAAVSRACDANIPVLKQAVDDGWDIISPVPSCVLMFRRELPLMFADNKDVATVAEHCFDPFEYLARLHRQKLLKTDFSQPLGKIAYQVACHQRVQNIGNRTREILRLIPGVEVEMIERCSGHDGSYAVRSETREFSVKIATPVAKRVTASKADIHTSDCPLAADHIGSVLKQSTSAPHPLTLLRRAYGIC